MHSLWNRIGFCFRPGRIPKTTKKMQLRTLAKALLVLDLLTQNLVYSWWILSSFSDCSKIKTAKLGTLSKQGRWPKIMVFQSQICRKYSIPCISSERLHTYPLLICAHMGRGVTCWVFVSNPTLPSIWKLKGFPMKQIEQCSIEAIRKVFCSKARNSVPFPSNA